MKIGMSKIGAIKEYFSVPGKPVTNHELIELRKADPKGFDEIGEACLLVLQAEAEQGKETK